MKEQKHLHRTFAYDEESRRKWQDPEAILREIGLKSGATFVDVGCGQGFFALPAARLVGKQGKVYGLDISAEAIKLLKVKAADEKITNLQLRVGRAEDTVFCEACADFVFFGIALHDFDDPARVIVNAAKMLKFDGLLANLDWKKEPMGFGPPLRRRFTEEKATGLIKAGGLRAETVKNSGLYHYLITARLIAGQPAKAQWPP